MSISDPISGPRVRAGLSAVDALEVGFDEEFVVGGDPRPVLPDGEYQAVCVGAEILRFRMFGSSRKVMLHFKLYGDQYAETPLFLPLVAPQEGQKIGRGSKLFAAYLVANGQPPARRDRITLRVFKNRLFRILVRTVKPRFQDGTVKPESFFYSVVAELLERLA